MSFLFLKTALRSLTKRKGYAALNISGLALGMASCLLIFKYVAHERSYDHFQKEGAQIYRVQLDDYQNGVLAVKCAANYAALAHALKAAFPEIDEAARFFKTQMLLSNEERNIRFNENGVYYAEPAFLDLFDVKMIDGDAKTALQGPDKIVISEDMARKYFGSTNVLGRILTWHYNGRVTSFAVSGVFRNYPINSHLAFRALASYNTFSEVNGTAGRADDQVEHSWYWTDFYTYIRLKSGADAQKLQAALPAFAERHINSLPDNRANHDVSVLQMITMRDIHLYSHYTEEAEPTGDGKSIAFLFMIGFIILGIAWINYINMSTSRSLERAREVGVRKLLGALRRDLINQFMLESLLINLFALLLAVIIALLLMKPFTLLTGKPVGSLSDTPLTYAAAFGALFLAGTFISGIYPAFVLSGYRPVTVLKGLYKNSSSGQWLRKGLIVGQFATSILLIAGTIIIYQQVQFMRRQNLGVDIDQTVVMNGAFSLPDSLYQIEYPAFKNEILAIPGINHMTASSNVMGQEILWSTNWNSLHGKRQGSVNLFHLAIDYDFVPAFGLDLLSGRNFSRDFPTDKKGALLNVSALHALGYRNPGEALHQIIVSMNGDTLQVTGVVADFHQEGLQKEITPLVMFLRPGSLNTYSVKIDPARTSDVIAAIKKIWDRYFPADPFQYFFLDEFFNRQYDENKRFGDVFGLFSFLAIVIACLGLLALSAYNVLQRTKEIGIRKVLGATVRDLVIILSRDFLLLVGIAFVVAVPVSVWAMQHWLQSFAYRINISWWIYAMAGLLSFLIALLTLSIQAVKAAMSNPVESLRTE
ncbi:MAG: ABC transporter permease [Chitinophagales bacterium]